MIKFDLERALAGDRVVTLEGEEVTQLTKFNLRCGSVLQGAVNGYLRRLPEHCLRMTPKPLSGWVNVYSGSASCSKHDSKALADLYADNRSHITRIACIDLSQHNEGEGI